MRNDRNLNPLGRREPHPCGSGTLAQVESLYRRVRAEQAKNWPVDMLQKINALKQPPAGGPKRNTLSPR